MKEGKWNATIVKHEFDTVGKNDTPMLRFDLDVDFGDGELERVQYPLWLTEKAFERLVPRALSACGFDYKKEGLEVLKYDIVHLCGREVCVVVGEDENKQTGELELRVQFLNRRPKPPSDDALKKMNEILRHSTDEPGPGDEKEEDIKF